MRRTHHSWSRIFISASSYTPSGTTAEKVSQEIFIVQNTSKMRLLGELLLEYKGTVLVFTRTKSSADFLAEELKALGAKQIKIGNRAGDNAEMAMIELVDFNEFFTGFGTDKKAALNKINELIKISALHKITTMISDPYEQKKASIFLYVMSRSFFFKMMPLVFF